MNFKSPVKKKILRLGMTFMPLISAVVILGTNLSCSEIFGEEKKSVIDYNSVSLDENKIKNAYHKIIDVIEQKMSFWKKDLKNLWEIETRSLFQQKIKNFLTKI